MSNISTEDLAHALSGALIDMRLEEHGFEAVETTILDTDAMRVAVTLRGESPPAPVCICPDSESDEIEVDCDFCLYGGLTDDPPYLTLTVQITSKAIA